MTDYLSMAEAKTPVSVQDVAAVLPDAYRKQYGFLPSRQGAALALGHLMLETGRFKAIYGYNVGNVICTGGAVCWRPNWFEPGPDASEKTLKLHDEMKAGRAPSAFAVFSDLKSGLARYFDVVGKRQGMSQALHVGDARGFSSEIVTSNYCGTCNADELFRSLTSLQREVLPLFGELSDSPSPVGGQGMSAFGIGIMLAVAVGGFVAVRKYL